MRFWWIGAALLAASVGVRAETASAPSPPRRAHTAPSTPSPITDHFAISGIYLWGKVSTTGQFNSTSGTLTTGTIFSAEQQLGLSSAAHLPMVELMFRLEQRNRLRFDFLDLPRTGAATVTTPIQYGSELFQTGQLVDTELDWRETDFTYTYSFIRTDRFELGAGPGLHLVQAYANAAVPNTAERETYSAAGPFATVALDGSWRLARHWSLNARGQYMRLHINASNGELAIYHADIQYRWLNNVSFGAGYESRRINVNIQDANPSGMVQLNITGPELFGRLSW